MSENRLKKEMKLKEFENSIKKYKFFALVKIEKIKSHMMIFLRDFLKTNDVLVKSIPNYILEKVFHYNFDSSFYILFSNTDNILSIIKSLENKIPEQFLRVNFLSINNKIFDFNNLRKILQKNINETVFGSLLNINTQIALR